MDQVRNVVDWSRRRKVLAAALITATLVVGILIGTVISGRVSATKGFAFAGTTATPLSLPDPIPSSNSFSSIVNRVEPAVVNIATTQVLDRKARRRQKSRRPRSIPRPISSFIPIACLLRELPSFFLTSLLQER